MGARTGFVRVIRSAVIAAFLGLALFAGSFGLGPAASAAGPSSVFVGVVLPDADGHLAERVRAISAVGTTCGTARVQEIEGGVGFYVLTVVSGAEKAGCPSVGDSFFLAPLADSLLEVNALHAVTFDAGAPQFALLGAGREP